jgi:HEAT repeat protein
MQSPIHKLAALAAFCCLVPAAGCAATAERTSEMFGQLAGRKTPDQALNIKTPDDHLEELRALAKTAAKNTPAEQERVSALLANEIKHESDPLMRRQILRTLAAYPTPLAFAVLTAGFTDSDLEVRRVACECLGQRGGPDAVRELARVAGGDTDIDVRIAAVRALGQTGDKTALVPLAEALVDADPAMQFRAQQSLRAVSGRDFGSNVQAWRDYVKTGHADAPEVNFAERIRRDYF